MERFLCRKPSGIMMATTGRHDSKIDGIGARVGLWDSALKFLSQAPAITSQITWLRLNNLIDTTKISSRLSNDEELFCITWYFIYPGNISLHGDKHSTSIHACICASINAYMGRFSEAPFALLSLRPHPHHAGFCLNGAVETLACCSCHPQHFSFSQTSTLVSINSSIETRYMFSIS